MNKELFAIVYYELLSLKIDESVHETLTSNKYFIQKMKKLNYVFVEATDNRE